jgi:hypothetical protein
MAQMISNLPDDAAEYPPRGGGETSVAPRLAAGLAMDAVPA